jgi:hypothetical protein
VPGWQRTYLAACAAVIGFAMAYTLCEYALWPRLIYAPVERDWFMGRPPVGREEVGYLGLVLWGLGGAAVGWLGMMVGTRLVGRPVGRRLLRLAGGWALTAVFLAGAFYTWSLWPF